MHDHPVTYLVTIYRHGHAIHKEMALTEDDAERLAEKFGRQPGSVVDITPIHAKAETDLTTWTREAVEDLQAAGE